MFRGSLDFGADHFLHCNWTRIWWIMLAPLVSWYSQPTRGSYFLRYLSKNLISLILGDPHLLGDSGKETCSAELEGKGKWIEKLHLPKPGKQFSCQHKGDQIVSSSYLLRFSSTAGNRHWAELRFCPREPEMKRMNNWSWFDMCLIITRHGEISPK